MSFARAAVAAALGALVGCAGAAHTSQTGPSTRNPPHAASAPDAGAITVQLAELRNDRGQVLVSLFRAPEGFPDRPDRAFDRARTQAARPGASLRFEAVPEGDFALAVHHDEDEDLAMATGLFGIPTEGYGFSRDATGSFGPPSFEAAKLRLAPGEHKTVKIRMRY